MLGDKGKPKGKAKEIFSTMSSKEKPSTVT